MALNLDIRSTELGDFRRVERKQPMAADTPVRELIMKSMHRTDAPPRRARADEKSERIAASSQLLRLASVNLIIAEEEDLAAQLDVFIDAVDTISYERFN